MTYAPPVASQTVGVVTFGTSSWSPGLLDIKGPEWMREWLDTTNMSITAASAGFVGNKTGIPSLYVDPGEVELTVQHVQGSTIPIGSALETITIKAGAFSSAQGSIAGSGCLLKYKPDMPLEGKVMTATATIRYTGPLTITAAT